MCFYETYNHTSCLAHLGPFPNDYGIIKAVLYILMTASDNAYISCSPFAKQSTAFQVRHGYMYIYIYKSGFDGYWLQRTISVDSQAASTTFTCLPLPPRFSLICLKLPAADQTGQYSLPAVNDVTSKWPRHRYKIYGP